MSDVEFIVKKKIIIIIQRDSNEPWSCNARQLQKHLIKIEMGTVHY